METKIEYHGKGNPSIYEDVSSIIICGDGSDEILEVHHGEQIAHIYTDGIKRIIVTLENTRGGGKNIT